MTQDFQGHKYVEWLRSNEKDLVRDMTDALPRNIMSTLKKKRQLAATTIKHIYNARHRGYSRSKNRDATSNEVFRWWQVFV
jgi:hypothetical protein